MLEKYEVELLENLKNNNFDESLRLIDDNVELLTSNNEDVITGIMTLLLCIGENQECITFGESKYSVCENVDYFYNLGIAYKNILDYPNAIASFIYALFSSTDESTDVELSQYINELVLNFSNPRVDLLLILFSQENVELTKLYLKKTIKNVLIIDGEKLNKILNKNNYLEMNKFEFLFSFLLKIVTDYTFALEQIFRDYHLNVKPILEIKDGTKEGKFALSELIYQMYNISPSFLEEIVFDYDFETLRSNFNMDEMSLQNFTIVRSLLFEEDYDQIVRIIDDLIMKGIMNSAFVYPLIFIYKLKRDYSFCLTYINQLHTNMAYANLEDLRLINRSVIKHIFSCTPALFMLDDLHFEKELQYAFRSEILDYDDLIMIVRAIPPKSLIIESYRGCNLKCPLCVIQGYNNFDNAMTSVSDFVINSVVNDTELMENLKKVYLHNLGEPLLNRNISHIISKIKEVNSDILVSIDSNLSLRFNIEELIRSNLDEIVVALDGYDQDSYSKYRINGNLKLVEDNMREIFEYKQKNNLTNPKIIAKTVMFRYLEQNGTLLTDKIKTLKIDNYAIQAPLVFHPEDKRYKYVNHEEWIDTNSVYSRYVINSGQTLETKGKRSQYCNGITSVLAPTVNYDGHVFPCCVVAIDNKYSFGNLKLSSFSEIWKSDKYVSFRVNKLIGVKSESICDFCTMNI